MAESDSEEEAEEQMRISFLGDVKKGGKASNGVLAGVADDQVNSHLPPAGHQSTYLCRQHGL